MAGWTCAECGLDYDSIAPGDVAVAIRSFPRRYGAELAGFSDDEDADALVRRRPDATTWSMVEYVAHVADLWATFTVALHDMARGQTVTATFWDPDERAATERYGERRADDVLADLAGAADRLADVLGGVRGTTWGETAMFPWGERDLLTMARNAVHEGSHHLRDVQRVRRAVRGRR